MSVCGGQISLSAGLTGSCELLGVGNQEKAGQQEEQQVLADACRC